ncbi:MAG: transporter, partial [Planctomycetota bacterium]
MNRSLVRLTAYLQIGMTLLIATGCAPTQPFFLNESPDLQYYLNSATQIEYPDVDVQSLAETTEAQTPLTIGNHDYEFWDLSLEECVSIALQNSKILMTTSGIAEARQNVADQLISGTAEQFGSVYDVAIQQSTTQSVPLTVDGNGNRVLPRGVLRANQVGGVEDALAEFDAQASAFFSYNTTDRPRNVGDSLVTVTQQQAQDATQQAAISKRFATGGVATLRQQVIYGRNNSPIGAASRILASDWTALIEAQVQHPLMRNRGTLVNRIPVILASLNEDISIAQFEAQVRNLVRDVENAYWDLYVNYRVVGTSIIGRNSAQATA